MDPAKDPAQKDRLEAVMYNLADAVRNIAILISPMMLYAAEDFRTARSCRAGKLRS